MSKFPVGWKMATLGEITSPRNNKADPGKLDSCQFIGLEEVEAGTGRIIGSVPLSSVKSAVSVFQKGDLLYGRLRPYLNKVAIAPFNGAASAEFIVFPENSAIDQGLLQRILMSPDFVGHTALNSTGDRPRVTWEGISSFSLALPPLSEQRRIVTKIDSLGGRSNRARGHLNHVKSLVSQYKKSILFSAFDGRLSRCWRSAQSVYDGPRLNASISEPYTRNFYAPSSWQKLSFNDVCSISGGSQPPKSTFQYSAGPGLIRLIQIRDYKSDDKATYIPIDLARKFCKASDIMIGRYGPPNFQILRGLDGAYNVALMKAIPLKDLIHAEYLFWYLKNPNLFDYVDIDAKRTAGQDGVNKAHLSKWPILLPPLTEQEEIVRRLEQAFMWIDRLATEATSARKLIDHLDQAVLSKAFRGELVPQDPNDEPASVLLERIKGEKNGATQPRRGRGRPPSVARA